MRASSLPSPLLSILEGAARWCLDVLLPPRCPGCGTVVEAQGRMCGRCFGDMAFIVAPLCRACGFPLPHAAAGEPLCGACAREPLPLERVRSAIRYEGVGRRLILRFKHGGRTDGLGLFAEWMVEAGRPLLAESDLIVPVPLHRRRLFVRGFNQSALLARAVAARSGVPAVVDLLRKIRPTLSQQGLSAAARRENVTPAAFAVDRRRASLVVGARVLLIDDVFTTGTTLAACARVLERAGAARVEALTLARVVRDEAHPI
ncbi:Adenine phosphoribosyltransferase [bacterium HR40]|nr:Adenine phosphoribosyltransferase [bacterium HR40]